MKIRAGQALMIVDWSELPVIRSKWKHDPLLLSDAVYALNAAISQSDVKLALAPPRYDITLGLAPPIDYVVNAQGDKMLGYEIAEKVTSAAVKLHAV
jgi:hypothetical protein